MSRENSYATLDSTGDVPADQLGNVPASAPDTADYLVGTTQAGLSAEIVVGATPGGELGGTWASPTVDATHSGSTHAATQAAAEATAAAALAGHTGDTADAHDASAVSFDPTGLVVVTATDVQGAIEELDAVVGGSGAPADADYLVGTAHAGLSAEIVVGATPGGELGGTWASPTVDATHSGSAHHDPVTVGTGLDVTGQLVELDLSEVAAGGELAGFMDAPTVDASHSGSTHAATQAAAEATAAGALTTHEGAADPHAGYLKETDFSASIPGGLYAPGSFTVLTERYALMSKRLVLTGAQEVTIQGTGRLRIN